MDVSSSKSYLEAGTLMKKLRLRLRYYNTCKTVAMKTFVLGERVRERRGGGNLLE
jgi:hypothetical protein